MEIGSELIRFAKIKMSVEPVNGLSLNTYIYIDVTSQRSS